MAKEIKKMKDKLVEEKQGIVDGKVGPNISFSKSKADSARRRLKNEILDTQADPILCDVNAPDEDRTIEGLLRLERNYIPSDNKTVSWRIPSEVMDWAQKIAREESLKQEKSIHYQKLVMGCFLEKYPMPKDK